MKSQKFYLKNNFIINIKEKSLMDFIDTKKIIDNIFYMLEQYKKLNKRKWILVV